MQTVLDSGLKIPTRNGTSDTKTALRLEQMEKSFHQCTVDAYRALRGINLEVFAGDFIAIVEGNGTGKSTLFDVITGSILVDSGRVKTDETDVTQLPEEDHAAMIGRVPQDPKQGTAPRMTAAEDLLLASKHGGPRGLKIAMNESKRQEFRQLSAPLKLRLENHPDIEIRMLSGGQRRSMALIMATLKNPRLLLFNECTATLDPKTVHKILDYTINVAAEYRLTAITTTHHLKDALNFGNQILVMNHEEIVHDFDVAVKSRTIDAQLYTMVGELEGLDRPEV